MKKTAPKRLSAESRRWWEKIQAEYLITDEAGLCLLGEVFSAYDRLRQAQKLLKRDGMILPDRFGQKKAHPALIVERDARSAFMQGMKQLNLDVGPLRDAPGRQGGS